MKKDRNLPSSENAGFSRVSIATTIKYLYRIPLLFGLKKSKNPSGQWDKRTEKVL